MSYMIRIAQGDMEALKTLYETYKVPVYRQALAMTGSRELAEDITQDTFLRIQEKAHMYHGPGSEAAWIYAIARNITYDILRKRSHETCGGEEALLSVASPEGDPEKGAYSYLDLIRGAVKAGCGAGQPADIGGSIVSGDREDPQSVRRLLQQAIQPGPAEALCRLL